MRVEDLPLKMHREPTGGVILPVSPPVDKFCFWDREGDGQITGNIGMERGHIYDKQKGCDGGALRDLTETTWKVYGQPWETSPQVRS